MHPRVSLVWALARPGWAVSCAMYTTYMCLFDDEAIGPLRNEGGEFGIYVLCTLYTERDSSVVT